MNFGKRLRKARKSGGVSQAALSERTGVAQKTLSRLENDVDEPRPETVRKLAAGLGVRPEELMPSLAFEGWLREHVGHDYIARSDEALRDLFDQANSPEARRDLFLAVHEEYRAVARPGTVPPEERLMLRRHRRDAGLRWTLAFLLSGLEIRDDEEAQRPLRELTELVAS